MHFGWPNAAKLAPKSSQKSIREGSWGDPGVSWGGLSGQDRKMRGAMRFLGSAAGGLGGLLGLSWAFRGGSGGQDGKKKRKKIIKKSIEMLMCLEINCLMDLTRF